MLTKENLNEALADAVMDRPREFFIGNRRFCLWSPSLGMSMMLERHISELGINEKFMDMDPAFEALNLSTMKKDKVCMIIAIYSFRKFSDLSNSRKLNSRCSYFQSHLDSKELSQLLLWILSAPRAETLIFLSPIGEQREKQAQIAQIKKSSNTITFGGTTIYGSLIAPAMSTLHMSYDDVVWGLSLINLKMLLADSINTVTLSEEEAKKYGMISEKSQKIGMSADDFARLKAEYQD